jgi:hypothetical protein
MGRASGRKYFYFRTAITTAPASTRIRAAASQRSAPVLLIGRSLGATRSGETCSTALDKSCVGVGKSVAVAVGVSVGAAVGVAVTVSVGVGVAINVASGESKGKAGVPLSGVCASSVDGVISRASTVVSTVVTTATHDASCVVFAPATVWRWLLMCNHDCVVGAAVLAAVGAAGSVCVMGID